MTRLRVSLAALLATFLLSIAATAPGMAQAAGACGSGAHGSNGYAYAGHQARGTTFGVRATITATTEPLPQTGHVAGWIGVGGPGQGANGETLWLQAGLAAVPDRAPLLYAEITLPGKEPVFLPLLEDVRVGESHSLAVLEMRGKPNWWRVWLDGKPAAEPILLPDSHRRWKPIVTAQSYSENPALCNTFSFRFERVGVATSLGGAWRPFVPGYDFLDSGFALKPLRSTEDTSVRTLASDPIAPYAFDASSA